MKTEFRPDWFSPPGSTLMRLMQNRDISVERLAAAAKISRKAVLGLLAGTIRIDDRIAETLNLLVGGSTTFWRQRQDRFDNFVEAVASEIPTEAAKEWMRSIPIRHLRDNGYSNDDMNKINALKIAMAFFSVHSPAEWQERYLSVHTSAAFRKSERFESSLGATALWLREGELAAGTTSTHPWSSEKFADNLHKIRSLSQVRRPDVFLPKLQKLCAECGVAFVVARAPSGCRASGAAKLLSPDKAMILMSFRYLSDDQFWFTFFHEAGHLLLHTSAGAFIDIDRPEGDSECEKEANSFAESILIPPQYVDKLMRLEATAKSVIRFSVKLGISPGIVVGQMQHAKLIGRDNMNYLKRRYKWEQILD